MKLSISNIGWAAENDSVVYKIMKEKGYSGLEIAPTRIFPDKPYDKPNNAKKWFGKLSDTYGFEVSSMQSIWFGRQEKIFGAIEERQALIEYTKQAINFAEVIGCKNLVFGCPKNRNLPDGADEEIAIPFFKELGDYAVEHNAVIGMEANPPIYNTNFINNTTEAFNLIKSVDSSGFKLNLDVGTMIYCEESADILKGKVPLINHVHISEPGLKLIEKRKLHNNILEVLQKENYQGFVSIEMAKTDRIDDIENVLEYVKGIFK